MPMLQTAGNTVWSKGKHFNWPRSISLYSLSLKGCLVKTRTRLLIVSTAQSWVYPSFPSSPHGRIGWHPTASSPFWLVPTTTWLVSTTTSLHSGILRPRSIGACLWEDGIVLSPSSFLGLPTQRDRSSWLSAPPGFSLGGPGNRRVIMRELLKWLLRCLIFVFSFFLDQCALGFPDSSCLFLIDSLRLSSWVVKGFLLGVRYTVGSRPEALGGLAFSQGYWRFFYAIARAACKILYLKQ